MNDLELKSGETLAAALEALANGDASVRLPVGTGPGAHLARAFNAVAEMHLRNLQLLQSYQSVTRQLQLQQEQLREANERLEQQAENLKKSELLLKRQQASLRAANEELEGKAQLLSEKMRQVEHKNRAVEQAKAAMEEKAEQLALSSRYKSEFLANMSHELRTPLNSLLILAKLLADNPGGNLLPRQVEYARTILAAGTDLLSLINDILDLAKVESGTMTLNVGAERLADLHEYVEQSFRQIAVGKDLGFEVIIEESLAEAMHTDSKRLRQILRNLLSNAFKFTESGRVELRIRRAALGWTRGHALDEAGEVVAFAVSDTGIGIAEDKQKIIFEEFQQADGTTSRQYGGTGLGLSISRELARLLGGEIHVRSAPGQGSTFTLYLPLVHQWLRMRLAAGADRAVSAVQGSPGEPPCARPADDRRFIQAGDTVVLIAERDAGWAASQLAGARDCGCKGMIASDVQAVAAIAREVAPDAVIVRAGRLAEPGDQALAREAMRLNVPLKLLLLPGESKGYLGVAKVCSVAQRTGKQGLLDAMDEVARLAAKQPGAVLLVAGEESVRAETTALLRARHAVKVKQCGSADEMLRLLSERRFDAVALADGMGAELMADWASLEALRDTPLIVFHSTAAVDGTESLQRRTEVLMVKQSASLEDALAGVRPQEPEQSAASDEDEGAHGKAVDGLAGAKALIIDDDIRNIFALTSALEHYGMDVIHAEGAAQGIELLKQHPDTRIALIDIMMPEIDGYDAIRIIRGMERFRGLPVIAVTAKAMKGDREKCIEAGASDYLAKPVRIEQLLSLLQLWLKRTVHGTAGPH